MSPPSSSPEWLERANRLALIVRQLSTTVHDVNNMLQVISGHAELLVTAPDANDVMLKRGRMISAQAQRATLALAELAAFARDVNDQTETVSLRAIAQQVLKIRSHALSRLRVSTVVEGDEVSIQGNARRLVQIALNLIVNAEKALAGSPHPTLRIAVVRAGDRVELRVEDNSTGEAAQTPGMASSDVPYSLGIGLEVSKWIAAQQGGELERVALSTGGSRVTLSLPVR